MEDTTELAVALEVAIDEVKKYIDSITDKDLPIDQVRDSYPKLVKAVRLGLVVLEEDTAPIITLKEPIKNPAGEVTITEIKFKSRIPVSIVRKIGLECKNNDVDFGIKCMAYVADQPEAILDKLGKFDYKVIEEISPLFI